MKKIIILISIIFIFLGCGNDKSKVQKVPVKVIPIWYESPKLATSKYIYAIANGVNKEQAVSRALKDIISQFGISVESSFESNTKVSRGNSNKYYTSVNSNIKTKVENIKINNYELTNSYQYRYNQYLVEVRVNKNKLNKYLKSDIKRKFKELNQTENSIKKENFIVRLNMYLKIYNKSKSYKNILGVIKSIDENFDESIYYNNISNFQKKYLELKNNFTISFALDNKSELFEKKLKTYLISKEIKISNQKSKLSIEIDVKTHDVNNEHYNIIVFNIALQLYSNDKLIGNNTIEIKEFNTNNTKRIKQKASQKFYDEIENKTFLELFNISI